MSGCVSLKWHESIDNSNGIGFERVFLKKRGSYCGMQAVGGNMYFHYIYEGMTDGHSLSLLVPADKSATVQAKKEKDGLCNGQAVSIRYRKESKTSAGDIRWKAALSIEGEVIFGDEEIRMTTPTQHPTVAIFQLAASAESDNVLYLARKMDKAEYINEFSDPAMSSVKIDYVTIYIRQHDSWWQLYGPHYISYDKYHYNYLYKNVLFYSGLLVTLPIDIITFPIQLLSVIIDPRAIPTPH